MMKSFTTVIFCLLMLLSGSLLASTLPTSARSTKAIASVEPALKKTLISKNLQYGSPIFIRIFKKSSILEMWVKGDDDKFIHFKNYNICRFSGELGPKVKEGDWQSPEGFYFVNAKRLNPWSRFHLSFNIGYPNQYDHIHGRTGSALMIHGHCVSVGCYAMTDKNINEIYALAQAALSSGQDFFRVHIFPFKLEDSILAQYQANKWHSFWLNLKQGYDYFEKYKKPPNVDVLNKRYVFK